MAVLNHCPEMGVISGTEQFPKCLYYGIVSKPEALMCSIFFTLSWGKKVQENYLVIRMNERMKGQQQRAEHGRQAGRQVCRQIVDCGLTAIPMKEKWEVAWNGSTIHQGTPVCQQKGPKVGPRLRCTVGVNPSKACTSTWW